MQTFVSWWAAQPREMQWPKPSQKQDGTAKREHPKECHDTFPETSWHFETGHKWFARYRMCAKNHMFFVGLRDHPIIMSQHDHNQELLNVSRCWPRSHSCFVLSQLPFAPIERIKGVSVVFANPCSTVVACFSPMCVLENQKNVLLIHFCGLTHNKSCTHTGAGIWFSTGARMQRKAYGHFYSPSCDGKSCKEGRKKNPPPQNCLRANSTLSKIPLSLTMLSSCKPSVSKHLQQLRQQQLVESYLPSLCNPYLRVPKDHNHKLLQFCRCLIFWAAANGGVTNGGLRGVWPPFLEIGLFQPFSPFFWLFRPFPVVPKSTRQIQKT